MKQPTLQDDVLRFLENAAAASRCDVNTLIRDCFHIRHVWEDAQFLPYIQGKKQTAVTLLDLLDEQLRIRNPGVHRVFRTTYIGYRREQAEAQGPLGDRSQIFASVRVLRSGLLVVLPIDPEPYEQQAEVEDLSGKGHHGVGDLQYQISDERRLSRFLTLFDGWLLKPLR